MSKNTPAGRSKDIPTNAAPLTVPGALYSNFGPLPQADVEETDSESVWAMFDDAPTRAAALMPTAAAPEAHRPAPDDDQFPPTLLSPL